jgi:4-amino-4-deoxychorismate lyase
MKDLVFFDTMRLVGGKIQNIEAHRNRINNTIKEAYGHVPCNDILQRLFFPKKIEKCRVVYADDLQYVQLCQYEPRKINTLKLVVADSDLDYHLKYLDRSDLEKLYDRREDCDDVLIVKDGFITDTSFSNVVFTDGKQFVTPTTYLLPGTMRASLLASGDIIEAPISVDDIKKYTHITLINAMLPLHTMPLIPIENIK